ncbi:efflux RND transporter periplasmic adaptor subunit [Coralloluteibacterium stylophorae]|uniref:Efflux RND transporter periplasmic adaptor subunit n=1 Tax=Coralloluteibacterium stylophorae TaxID=1776034 RepID=A0A8J8AWP9_9GAMM|nr:efflux RND transporter periplasmic adaptor subunit [Coralloluteibacterium stylophorae]MBS7458591.1 efflux RND transporter periplasmic adaptor subunit [Coralloluteibacterium stylophorae]
MTARRTGLPCALALASALALVACDAEDARGEAATEEAARVAVVAAEPARFGERFVLTGTFTADRATRLSPRVDGLVAQVHVDAGDRVRSGDVLLELDPAVGRQTLQRARAEAAEAAAALTEAERLYAQAERLGAAQYVAATQVEAREAEVRLARATLESARAVAREQAELLERHALPAPFDGVIAEKLTEVGEWVARSTPVLDLVALDRVRLDLRVPQERYAAIDGGVEIRVHADALDAGGLPARIGARVPVTDPDARTFLLRLLVEDPQGRLLPGASARAEIALPAREPALAVPRDALLRQPDGGYSLFVVEQAGTGLVARQRSVRLLRDQGDRVAVAEGLGDGERVVVRGNESLQDGQAVRLAER